MASGNLAPRPSAPPGWKRLADALPQPVDAATDLIWQEVEAHFSWYSRAAGHARIAYQSLKVLSMLLAAAVTVMAASGAPAVLTACFGAAIVVAEGLQQLFKFHTNWLRYRVATETLREHALLYVAHLAPYDGEHVAAQARLGELMRAVIEDERTQWSVAMKPSGPEDR